MPEKQALDALKCVDIIVGCVNNLTARSDLQEVAWRYCIPYVDVGLGLHPLDPNDERSEIGAISGNVFALVPGGPCLWCSGFLSEEKLVRESGGVNRSYLRDSRRMQGATSAALVSSFNGVLAGLAASDVLQLVLGFAPALPVRKQYDGLSGTVLEVIVEKNSRCPNCSSTLAAGDPLWQ
ncbi:MAG: ThiF family adenylyltransferase [Bryobacteraceae bacterium]